MIHKAHQVSQYLDIGLDSYFGLNSMNWKSENLSLSSDFSDIVLRLTLLLFTLATSNISPSNTFVFLSCVWFDGRCAEDLCKDVSHSFLSVLIKHAFALCILIQSGIKPTIYRTLTITSSRWVTSFIFYLLFII